jgi:hypothetical protein
MRKGGKEGISWPTRGNAHDVIEFRSRRRESERGISQRLARGLVRFLSFRRDRELHRLRRV